MAISAGTVGEIRATGSQSNSGLFYDRVPGTSVDYSQQDTAQLTLTDLATNSAGTTLSSATGGFTAAMAGNVIHITAGTGFTAGWYEITAYTNTNTVTIDRSAGASASAGTGYVGGAFGFGGSLDQEFFTAAGSTNTVWMKAGSYTMAETVTLVTGTTAAKTQLVGYNATRGDQPIGSNRPSITCGASYYLAYGAYCTIANLVLTGTATYVIYGTGGQVWGFNCKASNTSTTANRTAWHIGAVGATLVACELISDVGYAVYTAASDTTLTSCFLHDSMYGLYSTSSRSKLLGCVLDTCGIGYYNNTDHYGFIQGCTFYGGTTSVNIRASYGNVIINNIITGATNGLYASSSLPGENVVDYNCLNCANNYNNITAGDNDIVADPLLNDPANDDFTLASGSPCFDAGCQVGAMTGL